MATRYYDSVLSYKILKWIPESSNLRVLKPDETTRLFEVLADDSNDAPVKLPFIAISRDPDIELLSTIKNSKSYDGIKLISAGSNSLQLNVIPIRLGYQLDIYTKTYEEGDEYVRSFLFKLINNPVIKVLIPYQGVNIEHIANIRILSPISDTSDISQHLFPGQFTRWSIKLEIQDAFYFNIPYRKGWKLIDVDLESTFNKTEPATGKIDEDDFEVVVSSEDINKISTQ